jgi:arylformamidase
MVYQPIENYGNLSVGGFLNGVKTHRALLEAGIWIIEGLDLTKVKPGEYELVCLPSRSSRATAHPPERF